MINCLTDEYKERYGKTYEEQLDSFRTYSENFDVGESWTRFIQKMEFGNSDKYDAVLTWGEKDGSSYRIRNSKLYMQKVGDEWKVDVSPLEKELAKNKQE